MPTSEICDCCKEPTDEGRLDPDYGAPVCGFCHAAGKLGVSLLARVGVRGVFHGKCPDQPEGHQP